MWNLAIRALVAPALFLGLGVAQLPTPVICEDSIDGKKPFNENATPCLVGCPAPITNPADIANHGTYNATDEPYCLLRCLVQDPSPSQVSAAPECNQKCQKLNSGTPENQGWCMWWCLQGGDIANAVVSTSCVPNRVLTTFPPKVSTVFGSAMTISGGFETPDAWISWYRTQTIVSKDPHLLSVFDSQAPASTQSATSSSPRPSSSGSHSTTSTVATRVADAQGSNAPASTSSRSQGRDKDVLRGSWLLEGLGFLALLL